MRSLKSLTVALAALAGAAAVHAQYPTTPNDPSTSPPSGAIVTPQTPAPEPAGSMQTSPSGSTSSTIVMVPDPNYGPRSREEVRSELQSAKQDGSLESANGERTMTPESRTLTPEYRN